MAAASLTPAQLGSPELAHYGERLNFVAASAASSPSKPKRESKPLRRVTSGWIPAGARRRGSLRSSRRVWR